jgi:hypothetical protein
MNRPPIKRPESIGPGTVLGSEKFPYQSLIPGNPNFGPAAGPPENETTVTEFVRNDEARRFGRQVAEVNPPLDRSKIFRS